MSHHAVTKWSVILSEAKDLRLTEPSQDEPEFRVGRSYSAAFFSTTVRKRGWARDWDSASSSS